MTITTHSLKCRLLGLQDEFDSYAYDRSILEEKLKLHENFILHLSIYIDHATFIPQETTKIYAFISEILKRLDKNLDDF